MYLDYEDFRRNRPIPIIRIVSKEKTSDDEFLKKTIKDNEKIHFFDELGLEQSVHRLSIWGFSQNNKLYVQHNGIFNTVPKLKRLSHFISYVVLTNSGFVPYGAYYSDYYPAVNARERSEMKHYFVDLSDGRIYEMSPPHLIKAFATDKALQEQYAQLDEDEEKDRMFEFLKRYNERNPLYLPNHKNE